MAPFTLATNLVLISKMIFDRNNMLPYHAEGRREGGIEGGKEGRRERRGRARGSGEKER